MVKKVIIMGAAGRDFHNFNVYYRNNKKYKVVCFTATQIPGIEGRKYPSCLAGKLYKKGIPIYPEKDLPNLIKKFNVDKVVFSYSDVSHEYVMHRASAVLAAGADFVLLGPESTMLKSKKPVISVCAVRTGCGKSQTTRYIAILLKKMGKRVVVIRHPMPYGSLAEQACQRFATYRDLDKHKCTIEEREEYEPYIKRDIVVYAGVDYEKILRNAEKEADIILWDGGNNDFPFFKPDLSIVVTDPYRPCHELLYHPGETNFRMADIIVINKIAKDNACGVKRIIENAKIINPNAKIVKAKSKIFVEKPHLMKNKKVIVIEDGPTLTHGGMSFGAGYVAAKKYKAKIISPQKYAKGSIKYVYRKYKQVKMILPAMGYSEQQIKDLEKTINSTPADVVVSATPIDITKLIKTQKPIINVRYELETRQLSKLIKAFMVGK